MSMSMKKLLFILFSFVTMTTVSWAVIPLPIEQAFELSAHQNSKQEVVLQWKIAPGYYLYRDRVSVNIMPANKVATFSLPPGLPKQDEFLGKYEIYKKTLSIPVKIEKTNTGEATLLVKYQGCASDGFCYPPVAKEIKIAAEGISIQNVQATSFSNISNNVEVTNDQDKATQLLSGHNWWLILVGFFGFGLLLSFTPCVLPLVPIISGIIIGQGKDLTVKKAFSLSLVYVLAMALTYAIAGVFVGLAGSYVQAFLQNKWVIITISLIFVLLALSLFGLYELRMPAGLQNKLLAMSNRQKGGNYIGVAIMGILSTLVISPCVTAPLVGTLVYIGNTGDAVLGGIALFVLGLGTGVPLLIVGTSAGKLLPKAGRWMNIIKIIFGVMMLAMAVWLLGRVFPIDLNPTHWFGKQMSVEQTLPYKTVKSTQDLEQALADAKTQHKPVMLDFYADWCLACKKMDKDVFTNPQVKTALANFILLRADVTKNDQVDQELEKSLKVVAPPTIVFFDQNGQEVKTARVVGEMNAKEFLQRVQVVSP